MPLSVFISVADASGDQHAAELIHALKKIESDIEVAGIGGPCMQAAGATLTHETVGKAAMGWRGALRAFEIAGIIRETSRRYQSKRPDLHICIDSSAMNLPFAKMARSHGVPVLYYIAPQLWASREGRMKKMRQYVNRVACILPFEEEYYKSHGVDATFVGHPLFDARPADRHPTPGPRFPEVPPVIGIVPGSRRGEIKANLPHLLDVAARILKEFPGTRFLIPTTPAVDELVRSSTGGSPVSSLAQQNHGRDAHVTIELNGFNNLIPQCDLVLCKSGTSTLHVAAWGVPMIVVYRINALLWNLVGRWLIKTKKIALVNILAGNIDLVPEFIPWYGSNAPVAQAAIDLFRSPEKLAKQQADLRNLTSTFPPGASENAARIAVDMIRHDLSHRSK